jgi:N-hydroxyarylamine O-acetyltransferase
MPTVADYLGRIGYTGSTEPTAETLRALQRAHLFTVPFENLDIGLKRVIPCDEQAAVRKIVERRRGGFCYEMNGAFAWLLRELGYRVTLLSARVARPDGTLGPEHDHLTLRVDLDEPWLADVGFGDSFVDPLRLAPGIEQERYRITEEGGALRVEKSHGDQSWRREYAFTLQPRDLGEFSEMCRFHQTSPESHFTRKRICTLARPDGRITLADLKWIETRAGKREERQLSGEREWREVLQREFGVEL